MRICPQCGAQAADENVFCPRCGAELLAAPVPAPVGAPGKKGPYAVVGTWKFFWSMVLLNLPAIGWVFTIIWACGGVVNRNLQRLARAYILFWIVSIVWGLILYFTGLVSADFISRILAAV